jgi:hypothetical protein
VRAQEIATDESKSLVEALPLANVDMGRTRGAFEEELGELGVGHLQARLAMIGNPTPDLPKASLLELGGIDALEAIDAHVDIDDVLRREVGNRR